MIKMSCPKGYYKKSVYVRTLNGEYKLGMHNELINVKDTSNIRSHNYVYVPVGS